MDLRSALASYQASCLIHAKRIDQFLTRRSGYGLTYSEAEKLDDMVGVLMDQVDGMDNTWEDILVVVERHLIDKREDALFEKFSQIVRDTKKIVDEAVDKSMRFHILWDKDPGLDETKEMFFSAGEHENEASLDDSSAAEEDNEDDEAESEATNESEASLDGSSTAEEDDEDDKAEIEANDRHAIEVAQSWTGLDSEELETASADRQNMNPGTYFVLIDRSKQQSRTRVYFRPLLSVDDGSHEILYKGMSTT